MLYFISSDSRRNKNNINICESNILSLKEKITSLENTINEMSSQSQPNLENILNQFQNSNKFMNSDDLMFPLEEVDNDDEDAEDEDDEDEDDEDEDDEDEGAEDDDDDDEDDDEDDDDNDEDDDDDDDEDDDDDDDDDSDDDDSDDDDEDENEIINKIIEESQKIDQQAKKLDVKVEEIDETESENEEVKEEIKEESKDENKDEDVLKYMEKVMPSMIKTEKPSRKYPKMSLSKLSEGHVEKGLDGMDYIVTLNKLGRKFWKKSN